MYESRTKAHAVGLKLRKQLRRHRQQQVAGCPNSVKLKDESGNLIEIFRFAQNDSIAVFRTM